MPATGARMYAGPDFMYANDGGENFCYWLAEEFNELTAYCTYGGSTGYNNRNWGYAVRLVQDK